LFNNDFKIEGIITQIEGDKKAMTRDFIHDPDKKQSQRDTMDHGQIK